MKTQSLGLLTVPVTLVMLSCGDAAGPPAEGAVALSIHAASNAGTGYGCDISTTVVLGGEGPNGNSQGVTWVDGQDSHDISCVVSGDGTYRFQGEIRSGIGRFSVSGDLVKGGVGTANVNLFETGSALGLAQDDCEISGSGNYMVEDGAIWAGFNCSKLRAPDDIYTWCSAQGTFVFKSCDK